jgi:hypothetical protein
MPMIDRDQFMFLMRSQDEVGSKQTARAGDQ